MSVRSGDRQLVPPAAPGRQFGRGIGLVLVVRFMRCLEGGRDGGRGMVVVLVRAKGADAVSVGGVSEGMS